MGANVFTLPGSLEQVAALIKRMRPQDRQQLLRLVPELADDATRLKKLLDDAHQTVEQLRQELLEELGGQPLSSDEPFLGGLTLGQYLDLPEAERANLWEQWSAIDLEEFEELEVRPDAVQRPELIGG